MRRLRASQEEAAGNIGPSAAGLLPLFARNRKWAASKTPSDTGFFSHLGDQQRPRNFWIGCSDSRVPAIEIVDLDPGEMFVHRNVANLASANDPNFAAALQFAVEVFEVERIIVVGHYGCGGILAALATETRDAIGAWLAPVRTLRRPRPCMASRAPDEANGLYERNVVAQVEALTANTLVRGALKRGAALMLRRWVMRSVMASCRRSASRFATLDPPCPRPAAR